MAKSKLTTKTKARGSDTFIREVRVNYHSSDVLRFKIKNTSDAVEFLRSIFPDNSREHFIALYLDGNHQVACYSIISTGTANSASVHPREIFQRAIVAGAVGMIVAHNHPSGSLIPSSEDRTVTTRLSDAAALLGIRLLDSIIITSSESYSIIADEQLK